MLVVQEGDSIANRDHPIEQACQWNGFVAHPGDAHDISEVVALNVAEDDVIAASLTESVSENR
jgi:hypothetical protein